MKKCFLLISIVLIAFGFSFNLNAINTSKRDKNNNIEQVSSNDEFNNIQTFSEESSFNMKWEDKNKHIPKNLIVTPTTATVEYEYISAPKLEEIKFKSKNSHVGLCGQMQEMGSKKNGELDKDATIIENEYTDDGEPIYNYDGIVTADQNLYEGESYEFSYLDAYVYDGVHLKSTDPLFKFTTPTFETIGEFTIPTENVNSIEGMATVCYSFTPSKAEYTDWTYDIDNYSRETMTKEVPPLRIEWVDNGTDILGTANIDPKTATFNNRSEKIYTGEITTDEDVIKDDVRYTDTKLVVYDEFAKYEENQSNYKYESKPFDINEDAKSSSKTEIEVVKEPYPYLNDGQLEKEKIDYKIEKSEATVVNEISWKDKDGSTFEGAIDKPSENENKKSSISGTLETNDFTSGTEYNNTYLEAKTINQGNEKTIETEHIYHFKTPQIGDVWGEVTKIKGASTTLEYTIEPPTAAVGENYQFLEITNVFWKEYNKPNGKPLAEDNNPDPFPNTGKNTITGKLIAKDLPTRTLIENSYLEVTYLDSSGEEQTLSTTYTVPDFESGNFVTRDAILGAIALAIIFVITMIVLLLIYGYKKRRKVT